MKHTCLNCGKQLTRKQIKLGGKNCTLQCASLTNARLRKIRLNNGSIQYESALKRERKHLVEWGDDTVDW